MTVTFTQHGSGEQGAENITNDIRSARGAIERGDWLEAGMSISNVAMDVINIAGDPLGAAGAAGFGWIIQHISFLREPFDALLGDANSIINSAQGWVRAGEQLSTTAERYREAARSETCNWHGSAGDAYRRAGATQAEGLEALAQVSKSVGQAISGAGQLLAEVRKTVLDLINKCVQRVIQIIIEALAASWLSFGASIARGIAQSVAQAVQTASKIVTKVQKFISSLQKILGTVQKVIKLAKAVKQLLETIGGRANDTRGATTRQAPAVNTSGIDAAANRDYTNPNGPSAGPTYTQTAHRDYSYDQYRPGIPATGPTYAQSAPPSPAGYQPPAGSGGGEYRAQPYPPAPGSPSQVVPPAGPGGGYRTLPAPPPPGAPSRVVPPPGSPGFGPSGPPPDPGVPASRVDRARWIGGAVEILINHGVDPARIDTGQIAQIVDRVSGGNPHAIDMRDPNAANGFPPKGLMQITDPVFQQHHVQGYEDIWAPVDNLLAGVRYMLDQWGSLMEAMNALFPAPVDPTSAQR